MKKLFLAVAVIGLVGFGTSCKKECKCTTYAAGVVVGAESTVELESGKKCADYTLYDEALSTGIKCK